MGGIFRAWSAAATEKKGRGLSSFPGASPASTTATDRHFFSSPSPPHAQLLVGEIGSPFFFFPLATPPPDPLLLLSHSSLRHRRRTLCPSSSSSATLALPPLPHLPIFFVTFLLFRLLAAPSPGRSLPAPLPHCATTGRTLPRLLLVAPSPGRPLPFSSTPISPSPSSPHLTAHPPPTTARSHLTALPLSLAMANASSSPPRCPRTTAPSRQQLPNTAATSSAASTFSNSVASSCHTPAVPTSAVHVAASPRFRFGTAIV
ncbi:proline-rich receptor-like protein kinase PERK2 [Zingiber officinale]|uniref:proline-rich receptor-like protein kinase PERK2 n=1 Tax=Zingiber officinale TaxID=94328 RepID=UPI001C4CB07F|nr:proline-rich receptor-like protein kinase PERK2 [Zingiber officinale]